MPDNTLNSRNGYNTADIRKEIILLMLPIIAENFLQTFTDLIATAMVGRLIDLDISAQGMSSKLTNLVYYIFRGTSVALVILIAKRLSKDGVDACRTIFEKTAVATTVIALVLGGFIFMAPETSLSVFTQDTALIAHAVDYLKILVLCLPFWGITVCVASAFQAKGDTKTPMLVAVFVNILNTFLCWGLIFGNLGMPEMGYLGAAAALVISRAVGCVISIYLLYSSRWGMFGLRGKRAQEDKILQRVYAIALPNAGEWCVWQVATIILSRIILSYGQAEFAAYQLGVQVESMLEIPAVGFGTAAMVLISRAIGLSDEKLYRAYKKEMMRICLLISIITTAMLVLTPRMCMRVLTDSENLIAIGIGYLVIAGLSTIPMNIGKVYNGILRSSGNNTVPLKVQMVCMWGIRITASLICCYVLKLPLISIWCCFTADQYIKFFITRTITNRKKIFADVNA